MNPDLPVSIRITNMEKDPPIIIQNCNLKDQKEKFVKDIPTPK